MKCYFIIMDTKDYMKKYRKENRDKLREYQINYRNNNPEYVDKGKEYCKKYYQEHKQQLRKYYIKYRRNEKQQAYEELLKRYVQPSRDFSNGTLVLG